MEQPAAEGELHDGIYRRTQSMGDAKQKEWTAHERKWPKPCCAFRVKKAKEEMPTALRSPLLERRKVSFFAYCA